MLTLLPLYASVGPAELAGFPAVLVALIGYTHEAGKLNARRRDRLVAAVEALQPQFEAAMTSPHRATWARLYGQLLRAEGADAADPQAVGAWVDAFACRPYPQRRAALGLEALDDFTGPDSGGAAPLASTAFFRALIGERSRQAHLLLRQRLEYVVLSEELHRHDGPPLVAGAPEDEEAEGAWYDAQAGLLADRWTAAGLDALLRGRAAQLAPGLDRSAPLLGVVEVLAATHRETFGPGVFPLPTVPLPATARERAAAVRAAPLAATLAAAAADPDHADPSLLDLALASGFLRRGAEGSLLPGSADEIWREGTPAELAGLALNVLGALLAQAAADEETAEVFPGEHLGTLYFLYQHAGVPQSLARQAAEDEGWIVSPAVTTVPDTAAAVDGPYQLPAILVLSELTGLPGLTEEDREELQPAASRLAAVIDRLAPLGITTRTGNAVALTPLGSALLRDALILGTAEADNATAASFPTQDEVLSWDARQLADAAGNWPPAAARRVLCDWLAARGTGGWETLLPALSAQPSDDIHPARRHLLRLLDLGDAPAEALRAAVSDRVIGAVAERALRLRGLSVDAADVPASARAVLLADELEAVSRAAFLAHRMTAEDPDSDPGLPPELRAAVDQAAMTGPVAPGPWSRRSRTRLPTPSPFLPGPCLSIRTRPWRWRPGAPAPEAGQSRPPGTGRGRPSPGPLVPARAAGGRYAEASSTEKALVRARSASAARTERPTGNASSGAMPLSRTRSHKGLDEVRPVACSRSRHASSPGAWHSKWSGKARISASATALPVRLADRPGVSKAVSRHRSSSARTDARESSPTIAQVASMSTSSPSSRSGTSDSEYSSQVVSSA